MFTRSTNPLIARLADDPVGRQLIQHSFFRKVKTAPLSTRDAALFVGQWWHPLHYFPDFLARSVAALPDIASKSAIARILGQETGDGNPDRAHEVIYVDTMTRVGMSRQQVVGAAPFPETDALLAGYRLAASARCSALGFIFATEVSDLCMVSGIGTAVSRATGVSDLEWVNIHVAQEPDHVHEADHTMMQQFSDDEAAAIQASAREMWNLWVAFFSRLSREIWQQPSETTSLSNLG